MFNIVCWIIFITVIVCVIWIIVGMVLVELVLPFIEDVKKYMK